MNAVRAKQNITVESATILEGDSCFVDIDLGYLARGVQFYLFLYCFLLQEIVKRMALDEVPFLPSQNQISSDFASSEGYDNGY